MKMPPVDLSCSGALIGAGGGIVDEVEHVQRQLAAGDHRGAIAEHVAAVEAVAAAQLGGVVLGGLGGAVHDRVVDRDDLPGILDGAGDVDPVAHGVADAVRDRRLAVAGRTVHQDRAARAHRRAEMRDQAFGEHEVAHGTEQLVAGDLDVADRLALDLLAVDLERHRHRPEILRLRQRIERARLAGIGQLVAHLVARGAGAQRAHRFDQALCAAKVDQLLRDADRQAQRLGKPGHGVGILAEQGLQGDVAHEDLRQAHLVQPLGRGRCQNGARFHVHLRVPRKKYCR